MHQRLTYVHTCAFMFLRALETTSTSGNRGITRAKVMVSGGTRWHTIATGTTTVARSQAQVRPRRFATSPFASTAAVYTEHIYSCTYDSSIRFKTRQKYRIIGMNTHRSTFCDTRWYQYFVFVVLNSDSIVRSNILIKIFIYYGYVPIFTVPSLTSATSAA